MSPDRSDVLRVKIDQALDLVMAQRGEAAVPITTGDVSMVPFLRGGDAVLVVKPEGPPSPGDVILFRQNDYWVVHRFLGEATTREGRRGYRTRGDGRNVLDPLLDPANVLARVVAVRRGAAPWRSLAGAPARAYARLMAGHDLAWAAIGHVARSVGLGGVAAILDRTLLRLLVPGTFPLVHPRRAGPDGLIE